MTSAPFRNILPVEGATEPFWLRDLHELHNHRTTESLPESCDVVIIGAGYAGVGTAYNLVKGGVASEASKLSITILEARGACSGATGRNGRYLFLGSALNTCIHRYLGGHLRPDLYGHIPTYIKRFGVKAGEEFAKFEISHVNAIRKIIQEENIECDFTLTRTCSAFTNQRVAEAAKASYVKMSSYDMPYMDDVCFTEGRSAEGVCISRISLRLPLIKNVSFPGFKEQRRSRLIQLLRFGHISSSCIFFPPL